MTRRPFLVTPRAVSNRLCASLRFALAWSGRGARPGGLGLARITTLVAVASRRQVLRNTDAPRQNRTTRRTVIRLLDPQDASVPSTR